MVALFAVLRQQRLAELVMWLLTLCLWVNGSVIACDSSTKRFSLEDECRMALVQMVDGLNVTAMQKAGQDIDVDCVRMPFIAGLRPSLDSRWD